MPKSPILQIHSANQGQVRRSRAEETPEGEDQLHTFVDQQISGNEGALKPHVTRELLCSFADRLKWSDTDDIFHQYIPELVSFLSNPRIDPDRLWFATDQSDEASGETALMVLAQSLLSNTPASKHTELNESTFICILDLIDGGGDAQKEDDDNQTVLSTLQWKNPRDLTIVKVQLWAKHFGGLRNLPCAFDDYDWLAKVYMLKKLDDWTGMDEWERSAPKSDQDLQVWCDRISSFRSSGDRKFTSERKMNPAGRKLLLKILVGEDKGINLANVPPMDKVGWKTGSDSYCSREIFVTAIQAITHGIPSFHLNPSDKHQSATCVVVDAGRIYDRFISEEKVVVKFMQDKKQYECEVDVREQLLAKQASDTKESSHLRPIHDCIVPIESHFLVDQDGEDGQMWRSLVERSPRFKDFGKHVLIMPRGLRDLMDVLSHDRIAGHNEAAVSRYGRDIAICLLVMESLGYSHGDVKLLNVMIFQASTKQEMLKLIDLDAAVAHDEPAGVKLSTACVPPEVARLVVRYREMRLKEPTLNAEGHRIIEPSDDWKEWRKWLVAQPDMVLAKPTFDIWSFGTALYRLCVQDGVDLFLTSQADNIVEPEDLRQLAFEWDSVKLDKLSKINWPVAYDLILWCLEANPERRPQSFEDILAHPFFQAPSLACCPVGPDYSSIHPFDPRLNGQYFCYQYRPGGDAERAQDLHRAVESKDVRIVRSVLHRGGIHADILVNPSTGVTALHRAARNASVDIFMVMVENGGNINARTKFGFTCLHWAVAYSQWKMVKAMLSNESCDATAKNERGKTPWDLADAVYSASHLKEDSASMQANLKKQLQHLTSLSAKQFGNEAELLERDANSAVDSSILVLASFERAAAQGQNVLDAEKQSDNFRDEMSPLRQLATEKQRRKVRPHVPDNFRDEIELDHERFNFWTIENFSNWQLISKAGGFSDVYEPLEVSPWIQVSDGRRFGGKSGLKIAVKVPKGATLPKLQAASDDLKTEVESLAQLTHVNVVQILGMFRGRSPGTTREEWKMALEFCSSDLKRMLHNTEAAGVYSDWSIELMFKFLEQILAGLTYIHGQQKWHLDLKSENILLNKDGAEWICKIGDFGMTYLAVDADSNQQVDGAKPDAEPAAEDEIAHTASSGASANIAKAKDPEDEAYGTWEYMPPECTPRTVLAAKGKPKLMIRSEERSHYGMPGFKSDVFSFGVLMWEMLARTRICVHLLNDDNPEHLYEEAGKDALNPKLVPLMFVKGDRPRYKGLNQGARDQCGYVYYRLMQACWVSDMSKRPTITQVAKAFELALSCALDKNDRQAELTAIDQEAVQAEADKNSTLAQVQVTVEQATQLTQQSYNQLLIELSLKDNQEDLPDRGLSEDPFDRWLRKFGLQDKRGVLEDYEVGPDNPVAGLIKIESEWEDLVEDEDLGLDEETQAKFQDDLQALKGVQPHQAEEKSEFDPDVIAGGWEAARKRELKWPKWMAVQRLLPALSPDREGTTETAEVQGLKDDIMELRAKLKKAQARSGDAPELTDGTPP
eukprot:COSAG06_NODE_2936_length_6063_cov_6.578806_2_plen_1525_part_01